jgi:hypothetical protein
MNNGSDRSDSSWACVTLVEEETKGVPNNGKGNFPAREPLQPRQTREKEIHHSPK